MGCSLRKRRIKNEDISIKTKNKSHVKTKTSHRTFPTEESIENLNAILVCLIYIFKCINYRCRRVLHFVLQKNC